MKQVIQNLKSGKTEVIEVPTPDVKDGFLLVRTAASLVSAGTERNLVEFTEKSLVGKARSRPDLLKQVINKAKKEGLLTTFESTMNRLDQPLALGYSSAGMVVETGKGISRFQPGDRVVCAGGGYAIHAEYAVVPQNLAAILPAAVDFESGAFSTLGAIALNGIRLANPQLGESVAVIGLGLLGLLTAQLVRASGCFVYGSDINLKRIRFARKLGFQAFNNQEIESTYSSLTLGRGFDHVFICADTPSDETVELAGTIACDRGHVISLGVVGLDLPRKLYFEKELFFQVSRSTGPGRYDAKYEEKGADYPFGYVRWTEGRNLEAFVDLLSSGKVDVVPLITHRFSIENAGKAYDLITGKTREDYLGILLTYPHKKKTARYKIEFGKSPKKIAIKSSDIHLGVIGAGNYANAVFLPAVKKAGEIKLAGIAASSGISAQHAAKKSGFAFSTSKSDEIIKNEQINTIAVLTRHHTHAELTLQALKNGKNVYCEKPLGIKFEEIQAVEKELTKKRCPYFMVGFNRRFAPFSQKLSVFFKDRFESMYIHYRVNAGYLPPSHWLNDADVGGGRLIGEGCHFIDYVCFLAGQIPDRVRAEALPDKGKYSGDNLVITMSFPDGSIGSIAYLVNGSKILSKEYIEVFCSGKTAVLDDFRRLDLIDKNRKETYRSWLKQDKGHMNAWQTFIDAVKNNTEAPIIYQELIEVSYTILACDHAVHTGESVSVQDFMHST